MTENYVPDSGIERVGMEVFTLIDFNRSCVAADRRNLIDASFKHCEFF